eukprot:TRINITY_DN31718_c0_g1_i1.p1 TRINITY_DN31718_c0_g1~~TRINITY_DN31718_c0_g1_i1.p1  ORF type:complete len:232 (-),score=24.73 TRINITY_DN31718_c0_g1_i1:112-807(-)
MLREPASRLLSSFYATTGRKGTDFFRHFMCEADSLAARLMQSSAFSFEDWAQLSAQERRRCHVDNMHTKFLAGGTKPRYKVANRSALEIAKERLGLMSWFGLTERFDESLWMMNKTFNLGLERYTPVFNLNLYNSTVSWHAREVLHSLNELDLQLYKFAEGLFEERLRALVRGRRVQGTYRCDPRLHCWSQLDGPPVAKKDLLDMKPFDGTRKTYLCGPITGCVWHSGNDG